MHITYCEKLLTVIMLSQFRVDIHLTISKLAELVGAEATAF